MQLTLVSLCRPFPESRRVAHGGAVGERKCGWEGENYRLACQSKILADRSAITNPRKALVWMDHSTYQRMRQLE